MDVELNGLGQLESPRWHDGKLWYADWTAGAIRTLSGARTTEVKIEHRSLPLCFDFLPDGTLVIASGRERAILRASPGGALIRYADLSGLSPYGSNDIVADGRGNIYVNNVNFDFAAGPPEGEPAPGFVALVTPDGEARNVARDLSFPNGMAVTADNSTLVVAESYRHRLTAFDIRATAHWRIGASGRRSGTTRQTASASTLKGRSGMPMSAIAVACASAKVARYSIECNSTAARSPACSAAMTARPCLCAPHSGPE